VTDHLEYNGYLGSAEVSVEDGTLHGKLLFIRDVVTYEAATVPDLKIAFREAVDDYLQTCSELGDEPEKPCKGTFNVRVGPQRHRDIAIAARKQDLGLNDFVCLALDSVLERKYVVEHVHRHHVFVASAGELSETKVVTATTGLEAWESTGGIAQHH